MKKIIYYLLIFMAACPSCKNIEAVDEGVAAKPRSGWVEDLATIVRELKRTTISQTPQMVEKWRDFEIDMLNRLSRMVWSMIKNADDTQKPQYQAAAHAIKRASDALEKLGGLTTDLHISGETMVSMIKLQVEKVQLMIEELNVLAEQIANPEAKAAIRRAIDYQNRNAQGISKALILAIQPPLTYDKEL